MHTVLLLMVYHGKLSAGRIECFFKSLFANCEFDLLTLPVIWTSVKTKLSIVDCLAPCFALLLVTMR